MAAQQLSEALQRALAVDVETLMARAVTTLSGHSGAASLSLAFPAAPHAAPPAARRGKRAPHSPNAAALIALCSSHKQNTLKTNPLPPPPQITGPVHGVTYTHDEQFILSASSDGTARLWADAALERGPAALVAYRGHGLPVWDVAACPHGYYFATGSGDRSARVWALDRVAPLRMCVGALLPLPHFLLQRAAGGRGARCREAPPLPPPPSLAGWMTRHPSETLSLTVLSLSAPGGLQNPFPKPSETPFQNPPVAGHQADVDVVRWHPNCSYIATGSSDRTARLWDVQSGTCVRYLAGQQAGITALAFAPDGRTLVRRWRLAPPARRPRWRGADAGEAEEGGRASRARTCAFAPF
jgi:hypothetical protein